VTDVLGLAADDVLGQSLVRLLHPMDREIANERRLVALAESGGGHDRLELRYATAAGTWRWMSVVSRPLRDATGRVVGAVTALRDIQDEVERREEQLYRADRDPLTGLLTSAGGRRALGKALDVARGTDRIVGVLLVDIDGLGHINLEHGTPSGDLAIVHVADVLTTHLRETDSVARHAADEFLVVLSSVAAADHAERRARSLLELICAPRGAGLPTVRVSVGVATDDGSSEAADVLRRADVGLLHAKEAGGGQVSL
jgi:diguanylate cyclase (GGDEF)-like protein/PAS domain S-box-containing protein